MLTKQKRDFQAEGMFGTQATQISRAVHGNVSSGNDDLATAVQMSFREGEKLLVPPDVDG
jgi:hypothetical protein